MCIPYPVYQSYNCSLTFSHVLVHSVYSYTYVQCIDFNTPPQSDDHSNFIQNPDERAAIHVKFRQSNSIHFSD